MEAHLGTPLYEALKAEGMTLPDDCGDVELLMPVDGIFVLTYRVNVMGDNLIKLGRALASVGVSQQAPLRQSERLPARQPDTWTRGMPSASPDTGGIVKKGL